MNKKVRFTISIIEMIIAPIMIFVLDYHFDNDRLISYILPLTSFDSTLLRLSVYIIPGCHFVSSIFGLTFFTKDMLILSGVIEIFAGLLTLFYQGESILMLSIGILSVILGLLFIILSIINKEKVVFD